jgi:hypothetical protein
VIKGPFIYILTKYNFKGDGKILLLYDTSVNVRRPYHTINSDTGSEVKILVTERWCYFYILDTFSAYYRC